MSSSAALSRANVFYDLWTPARAAFENIAFAHRDLKGTSAGLPKVDLLYSERVSGTHVRKIIRRTPYFPIDDPEGALVATEKTSTVPADIEPGTTGLIASEVVDQYRLVTKTPLGKLGELGLVDMQNQIIFVGGELPMNGDLTYNRQLVEPLRQGFCVVSRGIHDAILIAQGKNPSGPN